MPSAAPGHPLAIHTNAPYRPVVASQKVEVTYIDISHQNLSVVTDLNRSVHVPESRKIILSILRICDRIQRLERGFRTPTPSHCVRQKMPFPIMLTDAFHNS